MVGNGCIAVIERDGDVKRRFGWQRREVARRCDRGVAREPLNLMREIVWGLCRGRVSKGVVDERDPAWCGRGGN